MKKNRTIACLATLFMAIGGYAQVTPKILGDRHAMLRLDSQKKYILLPVEEKMENAHIRVVRDNQLVKTLNCRLAVDKVDYFVPYEVGEANSSTSLSMTICEPQEPSTALPAGSV